jgi:hypothetical protein
MSPGSYDSSVLSSSQSNDKTIVDLDLIVEKWIMFMWEKTKTKQQASKYDFRNLEIIVNWGKVKLIQDDAKFDSETRALCNRNLATYLEFDGNFSWSTSIKGRLLVTLLHRKENNAFVKSFSDDIDEIISKTLKNSG